jgi:hypothetical protein
MIPTGLMKEYMDKGLFKHSFSTNVHFYDVEPSFNFPNGKTERNKFIRHLNKLGFQHYHSFYIHKELFK